MKCEEIWSALKGGMMHTLPDEIIDVLVAHNNHYLELVEYGGVYYAIECVDCNEVLFDDETLYTEQ